MTATTTHIPQIPDEIARAAILPESYRTGRDFWDAFQWLRANMPLGEARVDGYDPLRLVTRHADIMQVERDPALFHSCYEDRDNAILQDQANDAFQRMLCGGSIRPMDTATFMGPEEHRRIRGGGAEWFAPRTIRIYEDRIREHAREAVERLLSRDGECDFVTDFALLFPLHVIMTMLGVPAEDEPQMLKLTQEFFGTHDPEEQREEVQMSPEAAAKMWRAATDGFNAYFTGLADDKRAHPEDSLGSQIAHATVDGEPLPQEFQNGWYIAVASAGHDTTSSTISGAILALIEHPDQFAMVREHPELTSGLVDEALRWTSPVRHFMRTATADTEVGGETIRHDDRLMLLYPSANRDEAVFDSPESFDITRRPNRHIAFGFGPHACIGQYISKMEMRILMAELLPRLASIELAGEPRYVQTNFVGGLKSLPVRFTAA